MSIPVEKVDVHYVAHLKIERVVRLDKPGTRHPNEAQPPAKREIDEVSQVVVKNTDLEDVLDQVVKHVKIIAEAPEM